MSGLGVNVAADTFLKTNNLLQVHLNVQQQTGIILQQMQHGNLMNADTCTRKCFAGMARLACDGVGVDEGLCHTPPAVTQHVQPVPPGPALWR